MNLIAIDIGNTMITVGLFLDDTKAWIESIPGAAEDAPERLGDLLARAWEQIPLVTGSTEHKRDGLIVVSSVHETWGRMVEDLCRGRLGESIRLIGRDVPLPMEMGVDEPTAVGTDRVINAAAAFAVIEDACVVADFGTAVTIDLVDENGVFLGGVIAPGFALGAGALHQGTSKLPRIEVTTPTDPVGVDTVKAMNAGLFYSAVGLLRTITELYAEQLGRWPQTVVTGGASKLLKGHCDFVDSWVDDLTVMGIVIAYKKHLATQAELIELDAKNRASGRKEKPKKPGPPLN